MAWGTIPQVATTKLQKYSPLRCLKTPKTMKDISMTLYSEIDRKAAMVMRMGKVAFTPPTTPTSFSFAIAGGEGRVVVAHVLVGTPSRGSVGTLRQRNVEEVSMLRIDVLENVAFRRLISAADGVGTGMVEASMVF